MRKPIGTIASFLAACTLLAGCTATPTLYSYDSFSFFGAQMSWAFVSQTEEADSAAWGQITALAAEIEADVSVEGAESSVVRFNEAAAGEKVEIGKVAYELLSIAQTVYDQTDGAYNPALGNLVDLWGFTPRFKETDYTPTTSYDREFYSTLPDTRYVTAFLQLTDFSAVELTEENGSYYALKPNVSVTLDGVTYTMRLDLGGISKGYCVDGAEQIIRAAGYGYGYFNLGGSSMAVLKDPRTDGAWEVGVIHPRASGTTFMNVVCGDSFISTSGDYMQYYEIGGVRYCHIIDPYTGYPVNASPSGDGNGIVSATVIGLSATEGDAVTTALLAMGKTRAISYIRENLEGKGAVFVWYDAEEDECVVYTNLSEESYSCELRTERI